MFGVRGKFSPPLTSSEVFQTPNIQHETSNFRRQAKILDQVKRCAHRSYLIDFIKINIVPKKADPSEIRRFYLEEGLSASQIGEQLGVSKQMILSRLRASGIHKTQLKGRSPENYRYPHPPFGLKVVQGRLVPHIKEMKVVRLIVELRERKRCKWVELTKHLNESGYRTRRGRCWTRNSVKRVHSRWRGKI